MVKLPPPDFLRLDKRTMERYKALGKLKDKEFDEHLKSLPNEEENVEKINIWERNMTLPSKRLLNKAQQSQENLRNIMQEASSPDDSGNEAGETIAD